MFNKLGNQTNRPSKELEIFDCPNFVSQVSFETGEVTSFCPVTEQPDLYHVVIDYKPDKHCIETKSLKLYLWTFRERGLFAETLASEIAQDVFDACLPKLCRVTAIQQIRGGIKTSVTAEVVKDD